MKNVIVVAHKDQRRIAQFENLMRAQIDNSLRLGWSEKDILICSSFDFSYRSIYCIPLIMDFKFKTNVKTFGVLQLIKSGIEGPFWTHDLDAWQVSKFTGHKMNRDVMVVLYKNKRISGASVFYTNGAIDILQKACDEMRAKKKKIEEPTLSSVFDRNGSRVEYVDFHYNLDPVHARNIVKKGAFRGIRLRPENVLVVHKPHRIKRLVDLSELRQVWESNALDLFGRNKKVPS